MKQHYYDEKMEVFNSGPNAPTHEKDFKQNIKPKQGKTFVSLDQTSTMTNERYYCPVSVVSR